MRVISGTAKGHRLVAPRGDRIRPALDQVKEAIFNILFDIEGLRVLDLYAGSGSVGIEALSRGAAEALFVEEWEKAVEAIHRNLAHTKLAARARVMKSTVEKAIPALARRKLSFDLIFVDPPYLKEMVNRTLEMLSESTLVAEGARVVVEHHPKEPVGDIPGLALTDNRKYGQTLITFLRAGKRGEFEENPKS